MEKNPYSALKVYHHYDRIEDLRNKKQPVPVAVRLVLSDLRNQNCHFCTFRMENSFTNKNFSGFDKKGNVTYNPMRFLDRDKSMEVIKDAAEMGIKSIEFTGGGEPTVHPKHVEIFKAVLDSGMDLGLISNGVVQRPGFIDTMLRATWVRFSIDAGNKESYSKIRRVPEQHYDTAMKNIKALVDKRDQEGSKLTIGMSFIVTDQNWSEIHDAAKVASEIGVDYFRVGYYRTDDGFVAGDFKKTEKLIEKAAKDFNTDKFTVLNRYSDASKNLDGDPDYDFCAYQHVSTWIAADYNVYRCCVTSYDKHGLIGSIKEQSFKELWNSDLKKKKFDEFNAKSCKQCINNDKNKMLNYAIDESSDHKNFI